MKKTYNIKRLSLSTIKSLHKWLSLIVFIQLFIWLISGLFFNLMDHDKARGNEYRKAAVNVEIEPSRLIDLKEVLNNSNKEVKSASLVQRLGKPYYLLTHKKGLYKHVESEFSLIDAYSGAVTLITDEMAIKLAQSTYSGEKTSITAVMITPPIDDFLKEKNTVWRVDFLDSVSTSVYINASSGRLIGHSNDDKRFADFFFMLHFMDYPFLGKGSVGGFNNGQITFFALLMLLFSLTGIIWTIELLRKGRYRLNG